MAVYTSIEIEDFKQAYALLSVEHGATRETIKSIYRALIKEWHPDKWAQDNFQKQLATDKIQAINAAFDLIEDAPLLGYKEPLTLQEDDETDTVSEECAYSSRFWRYRQRKFDSSLRRRHASPEAAASYRKKMGMQFRFVIGFISSVFPLAFIRFYFFSGAPFLACCVALPLLMGLNAARKNVLEDDETMF